MLDEQTTSQEELQRIADLEEAGHTYHCACRMVYGDGECECELRGVIPGPLSRWICELSDRLAEELDSDDHAAPGQGENSNTR